MQAHGYNVTNLQVENKFKSLERSYKNMKFNNKQTGRSRATCLYETELTELLGHKHKIEPLAVSGSEGLIIREDMRASTSECDTSKTSETISMDSTNTDSIDTDSVNLSDHIKEQHANNKILTSNNDNNNYGLNKVSSTRRKHIGPTGRFLEKCQQTIEKLVRDNEEERNIRVNIQQELLTGYKETNKIYEEQLANITKELQKSNMLKEEKNNLLREYINIITNGIAKQ